jgi:hypothetical protein
VLVELADDRTVIRAVLAHPLAVEPDSADTVVKPGGARSAPVAVPAATSVVAAEHYAFILGDSHPVPLDKPCTIGRAPSVPRVQTGAAPRLVRVASPKREVSASHLELRQVGATVVATDLRSTNGTVVQLPGSAARTLRQGESMVVTPGTLIDLGDGNVLTVLPLRHAGGAA